MNDVTMVFDWGVAIGWVALVAVTIPFACLFGWWGMVEVREYRKARETRKLAKSQKQAVKEGQGSTIDEE